MATTIQQKPLYTTLPVGQQIIFTVFNTGAVESYWNVKYIAEVHITTGLSMTLGSTSTLVATFKTTPNNAGVGIFDFRPLLESYVSSDNTGSDQGSLSEYKTIDYSLQTPHPIHLIDRFCKTKNSLRNFAIRFKAEGSTSKTAPVLPISNSTKDSAQYLIFNGVLQHDNYLTLGELNNADALIAGNDYGYNLSENLLYTASSVSPAKFLSNAPTTQYANIEDYGTLAFLNFLPNSTDRISFIYLVYYKNDGTTSSEQVYQGWASGGATNLANMQSQLLYFGAFPGNLRNYSSMFQGLVTAGTIQGGYYTVQAKNDDDEYQELYTINVNCPNTKGYESIRLTWLNQWGVWDYYTFTKKSVRSLSTNRTTYTQAQGTWNDSTYRIDGFKGGKKNFRVNSTEKIQVNSDFVSEADSQWFEELVNSQEVYILNGYDASETPPYNTMTNKYVEPVLITTSSYIRKTIANDKLMQYTFEMERNKTLTTQTS
tara:strand:- start:2216 stop:3670 length:1455 start_codon:yes stop_codon:yes gene_type:complete